jgi:hypothetical protein
MFRVARGLYLFFHVYSWHVKLCCGFFVMCRTELVWGIHIGHWESVGMSVWKVNISDKKRCIFTFSFCMESWHVKTNFTTYLVLFPLHTLLAVGGWSSQIISDPQHGGGQPSPGRQYSILTFQAFVDPPLPLPPARTSLKDSLIWHISWPMTHDNDMWYKCDICYKCEKHLQCQNVTQCDTKTSKNSKLKKCLNLLFKKRNIYDTLWHIVTHCDTIWHFDMFVTLKVCKLIGPSNDSRRHVRGTYLLMADSPRKVTTYAIFLK